MSDQAEFSQVYPKLGKALSPREVEALYHAAHGLVGKEIAAEMGCSLQTVKNHLHIAHSKLGVSTTIGALLELGWLRPGGLALSRTEARLADMTARLEAIAIEVVPLVAELQRERAA